jgi:hypothetical protein
MPALERRTPTLRPDFIEINLTAGGLNTADLVGDFVHKNKRSCGWRKPQVNPLFTM